MVISYLLVFVKYPFIPQTIGIKCIENSPSRSIAIETVCSQRKAFLFAGKEQAPRKWLCRKGQREEYFLDYWLHFDEETLCQLTLQQKGVVCGHAVNGFIALVLTIQVIIRAP